MFGHQWFGLRWFPSRWFGIGGVSTITDISSADLVIRSSSSSFAIGGGIAGLVVRGAAMTLNIRI